MRSKIIRFTEVFRRMRTGMRLMALITIIIVFLAVIILSGCSVVFTSSLSGSVLDGEKYHENPDGANGISQVFVYCYTDENRRDADLAAWNEGTGVLPDDPSIDEPAFFASTVTDDDGGYEFNGLIWNELLPEYGKSGDRFELFMLYYHPDFGLQKNPSPIFVVSDVTNILAPVMIDDLSNSRRITGTVIANDSGEGLQGATVSIYLPESWGFDDDGNIDDDTLVFTDTPSYRVATDEDGEWEQEILFSMMPNRSGDRGKVKVLLTFEADGYRADTTIDTALSNDRDVDRDGDIDEEDVYTLSSEIEKDDDGTALAVVLGEVELVPHHEEHTATLRGRVVNQVDEGEGGLTLYIHIPRRYYPGTTTPTLTEGFAVLNRAGTGYYAYDRDRASASVNQITTDGDGYYEQEITYPLFPDEDNDSGIVEVLIFMDEDDYSDPPVDGTVFKDDTDIDGDEVNDVYYHPAEINRDSYVHLADEITVKRINFSRGMDGQILNSAGDSGVNNTVVWIFPFDDTGSPTLADGAEPYDRATSASRQVDNSGSGDYEAGHFSFEAVPWSDTAYTSRHSGLECDLYLPTGDEVSAGAVETGSPGQTVDCIISSSGDNFISIQLP